MRLLIIDLMPLLYRGHFAMIGKPRMTSRGVNTSALHFFVSTLFGLISRPETTHAVLVMDSGKTFRNALYPPYKAQRDKMPEDIALSIEPARSFAAAFGVPVLAADGLEADDVAGSLAAMADRSGWEAWIVSPDKDMAQLVTDRVSLVRPSHAPGEKEDVYDPKRVCAEWGLAEPSQMVDWLGMAGDAADNIPGFDGIGPKKASELLARFGSLRGVLEHVADIPGKTGEKIAASADKALLSRKLAEIRRDVPLDVTLEDFAVRRPLATDALQPLLERYEFATLSRRIFSDNAGAPRIAATAQTSARPVDERKFSGLSRVRNVASNEDVEELAAALRASGSFAFWADASGIAIAASASLSWFIPASSLKGVVCDNGENGNSGRSGGDDLFSFFAEEEKKEPSGASGVLETLSAVFGAPDKVKIGYDQKKSLRALRRFGIEAVGPFEDAMLAHYVLDPTRRHSLENVFSDLGFAPDGETATLGAGSETASAEAQAHVNAGKCARLFEAAPLLEKAVDDAGASRAWKEAENPLVPVLLDMEDAGVLVDASALSRLSINLGAELADLGQRIFALAGEPFNIDSPKQLGKILFEKMGLQGGAKTASGGYSTAEEVLQGISGSHPVVPLVLEWRAVSKLKSTYVDKLPQCISPKDGRVHTTFQQALTETGRLSSDNPNLQNIPIRTDRGKPIRAAFVAAPGHVLVSADYSQIELRVMASLSQDETLLEAFRHDEDIHAATAAKVFGIAPQSVTREQRSHCKQVSFGIIYGISPFGLSQRLGMSRSAADALIKAWFEMHPGVRRWIEETTARARACGFVTTLLGRRRPLRDIASRNATLRAAAERMAVNTPVQGTAADIAKLAMVRVHSALRERGLVSRLILQIHDELVVEAPCAEKEEVQKIVRESMENAMTLAVPLKVDVGTGNNWLEAH